MDWIHVSNITILCQIIAIQRCANHKSILHQPSVHIIPIITQHCPFSAVHRAKVPFWRSVHHAKVPFWRSVHRAKVPFSDGTLPFWKPGQNTDSTWLPNITPHDYQTSFHMRRLVVVIIARLFRHFARAVVWAKCLVFLSCFFLSETWVRIYKLQYITMSE